MDRYVLVSNPVDGNVLVVDTDPATWIVIAACDSYTEANQVAVALNA